MVEAHESLGADHGDRLLCVLSTAGAEQHGEAIWVGLGWAQDRRTAGDVFVEHHSGSEEALRTQIGLSLADLCASRGWGDVETGTAVAGARCVDDPVCAVAVAAFEVRRWGSRG